MSAINVINLSRFVLYFIPQDPDPHLWEQPCITFCLKSILSLFFHHSLKKTLATHFQIVYFNSLQYIWRYTKRDSLAFSSNSDWALKLTCLTLAVFVFSRATFCLNLIVLVQNLFQAVTLINICCTLRLKKFRFTKITFCMDSCLLWLPFLCVLCIT